MSAELIAGAQRIIITPPVGVDLTGFGGREKPAQGVHDDLRGCALYLSDGNKQALLITADLIGLHHDEVAQIRAGIQEQAGIPPEAVMISCSHTHSGPATHCLDCLGEQDDEYLTELKRKFVGLAVWAKSSAQPAQVGWSRPSVSAGVNRRESRNGQIVLGINEDGLTAPYADVLYVDDLAGKPVARLFCHAAHAVTLGPDNLQFSGDWPGYAQRETEAIYGGDCVAMFMQGCCGDINSHPRGGFEQAEMSGRTMAAAVAQADGSTARHKQAVVDCISIPLELPLEDPPSVEEAEKQHAQMLADYEAGKGTDNYGPASMKLGLVKWAGEIVELARTRPPGRTVPFEVQAIRVGGMGFVGLPGEVFVEYQLNIDAASPLEMTAVPAYTNGNIGYVPTAAAYPEGGYEIENAIKFYGTTMQTPESEELILRAAAEALDAIGR